MRKLFDKKTKCLSFEDYNKMSELMPNGSMGDVFDKAWEKTPEGIEFYENRRSLAKSLGMFVVLTFVVPTLVTEFSMLTAFAGVKELEELSVSHPILIMKVKDAIQTYKNSITFFGIEDNINLFVTIIKEYLTGFEIDTLLKAANGISFRNFLDLIPTLLKM